MGTAVLRTCFGVLLTLPFAPLSQANYKPGPGWPEVSTPFYHAATPTQMQTRLAAWHEQNLVIQGYQDTGSMRPVLKGGREVMALERCFSNTPLARGQMVQFNRGDKPAVLHYIADVSRDGQFIYLSGVNNRYSDGWFPRAAVAYVVREIIVPPDLQPLAEGRQTATAAPQDTNPALQPDPKQP
jgi:hypothetical protein